MEGRCSATQSRSSDLYYKSLYSFKFSNRLKILSLHFARPKLTILVKSECQGESSKMRSKRNLVPRALSLS